MGTPKCSSSGVHVKQEAKYTTQIRQSLPQKDSRVREKGLRASTKHGYRCNKIRKTQYSPV